MLVGYRMMRNPITIAPDISIAEVLDWMRQQKVHRLPVVDKVADISKETLLEVVKPLIVEVLDVREI